MYQTNDDLAGAVVLMSILLVGYFLPWMVGKSRDIQHNGILFFINLLAGWTVVGWLACLIWATCAQSRERHYYRRSYL
jgi:fucose permease